MGEQAHSVFTYLPCIETTSAPFYRSRVIHFQWTRSASSNSRLTMAASSKSACS